MDRKENLPAYLARAAVIGFSASAVSDTVSNSLRVLKTTKQTSLTPVSYGEALNLIVQQSGVQGLFLRGLGTKIISNGIQGLLFNVMWRLGQDALEKRREEAAQGGAPKEDPAASVLKRVRGLF